MRLPHPALFLALATSSCVGSATATTAWSTDFEDPADAEAFEWTQTHPSVALAHWTIVEDPTAPSPPRVLALTRTENTGRTFNLALARDPCFGDLELSVWVRPESGRIDQGGGPVWRARDANNYYVCRFNPLESNFRLYVVADGERRQLDSAQVSAKAGEWHHVEVRMRGGSIRCSLDGEALLEAEDSTIDAPGRVGLWTKADAATRFDDLAVAAIQGTPGAR